MSMHIIQHTDILLKIYIKYVLTFRVCLDMQSPLDLKNFPLLLSSNFNHVSSNRSSTVQIQQKKFSHRMYINFFLKSHILLESITKNKM